jgi:hypothetical protein
VIRPAAPWRPGGRYTVEIHGVRNVTGVAGDVVGALVVPERPPRDSLAPAADSLKPGADTTRRAKPAPGKPRPTKPLPAKPQPTKPR